MNFSSTKSSWNIKSSSAGAEQMSASLQTPNKA
jgi:hypothetical protein